MNILMLGWEFPPYFSGGVGVVCEALSRALVARGDQITFVMPAGPDAARAPHLRLLVADRHVPVPRLVHVPSLLQPYQGSVEYERLHGTLMSSTAASEGLYGSDLLSEVDRFGARVVQLVEDLNLDFDVIHAHDWTTFAAGIELKSRTGKPLVVHVHITEFDKSGGSHADPRIYRIEQAGMQRSDAIIAVSHLVKQRCVQRYHADSDKIHVVHNGVERSGDRKTSPLSPEHGKVVLFLGRVTLQKGPDYFMEAAQRVLQIEPEVTFVLSGTGDMLSRLVERSAELGIGSRMLFTGFVDRDEAAKLYALADVFVMPSVSEPFGLVALEAMDRGVPLILSRQSGAAEVIRHALKINFWDVDDFADKILAALSYSSLKQEMTSGADRELDQLSWSRVAARVGEIHERVRSESVWRTTL